ncbi:hypothetical protein AYO20_11404 [Fonsecaea nubica]|uniref:Uncharacterized protein n=1 Tax=Fonsecaea nubica TaxID=856822 RepID=A0A178BW74_9EURO|nr:hypothetical protein AYO20_11404 [Fonsecaea nubica]OAL21286.1 hypothetical protein AYO20_11404 [Fonsecaea nubica]
MADISRERLLYAIFHGANEVFGDDNDDWMLIRDLLIMGPEASEEAFDTLLEIHGLKLDGQMLVSTETEPRTGSTDDSPSSQTASSADPDEDSAGPEEDSAGPEEDSAGPEEDSAGLDEESHIGTRPPGTMVFLLSWCGLLSNINLDFKKYAERMGVSESEV